MATTGEPPEWMLNKTNTAPPYQTITTDSAFGTPAPYSGTYVPISYDWVPAPKVYVVTGSSCPHCGGPILVEDPQKTAYTHQKPKPFYSCDCRLLLGYPESPGDQRTRPVYPFEDRISVPFSGAVVSVVEDWRDYVKGVEGEISIITNTLNPRAL